MWFLKAISARRLPIVFAIFVLLCGLTFLLMPYRPRKWPGGIAAGASNKRLNLILLSEPRSGSSFTGEVFQQHNDVFYLYEPLFHFSPLRNKAKESPESQNHYNAAISSFLSSVFLCNFNDSLYIKELKTSRNKMRCPDPNLTRTFWASRYCKVQLTRQTFEDVCKRRKLTVAKLLITRLPGVIHPATKELAFFCNSSSEFECLFIYLVRDPRAVISSLLNIGFFNEKMKNVLKSGKYSKEYLLRIVEPRARRICHTTLENIDYIQGLSSWLGKKILILRYEDLVTAPQKVVEDLYKFAGLHVTKNIAQWLRKSTSPAKRGAVRNKENPYSTVRNSLEVLRKWRKNEQLYVVKTVEDSCKEAMQRLGYVPIKGFKDLQKNLTIPLFTKLNPLLGARS